MHMQLVNNCWSSIHEAFKQTNRNLSGQASLLADQLSTCSESDYNRSWSWSRGSTHRSAMIVAVIAVRLPWAWVSLIQNLNSASKMGLCGPFVCVCLRLTSLATAEGSLRVRFVFVFVSGLAANRFLLFMLANWVWLIRIRLLFACSSIECICPRILATANTAILFICCI